MRRFPFYGLWLSLISLSLSFFFFPVESYQNIGVDLVQNRVVEVIKETQQEDVFFLFFLLFPFAYLYKRVFFYEFMLFFFSLSRVSSHFFFPILLFPHLLLMGRCCMAPGFPKRFRVLVRQSEHACSQA